MNYLQMENKDLGKNINRQKKNQERKWKSDKLKTQKSWKSQKP